MDFGKLTTQDFQEKAKIELNKPKILGKNQRRGNTVDHTILSEIFCILYLFFSSCLLLLLCLGVSHGQVQMTSPLISLFGIFFHDPLSSSNPSASSVFHVFMYTLNAVALRSEIPAGQNLVRVVCSTCTTSQMSYCR